mmetsp:Transcript_27170/g.59533  ORF Transcript_27170/g.59533 Transcript_27170/m.59533 type:complete len:121 (+) Transcript_27170:61-423(+)
MPTICYDTAMSILKQAVHLSKSLKEGDGEAVEEKPQRRQQDSNSFKVDAAVILSRARLVAINLKHAAHEQSVVRSLLVNQPGQEMEAQIMVVEQRVDEQTKILRDLEARVMSLESHFNAQ